MTAAKLQYREKLENKSGNVAQMLLKCAQVAQVFSLIDVFLANAQQLLHFIANNLSVSQQPDSLYVGHKIGREEISICQRNCKLSFRQCEKFTACT